MAVSVNPSNEFIKKVVLGNFDYIQLHGSETSERVKEILNEFTKGTEETSGTDNIEVVDDKPIGVDGIIKIKIPTREPFENIKSGKIEKLKEELANHYSNGLNIDKNRIKLSVSKGSVKVKITILNNQIVTPIIINDEYVMINKNLEWEFKMPSPFHEYLLYVNVTLSGNPL